MPDIINMARVLQKADASFMPDKTPEQIGETIKDPVAAGAFYDILKQKYPTMVDLERDAFVEQVTGKPAKKFRPKAEKVRYLADKLKTRYPDFKGNVSSEQLSKSWEGLDASEIYKQVSELEGFVDIPYASFEQLMSEDDPHVPYKEPTTGSMWGDLTWQGRLLSWWKGDAAKERKITEPKMFTGDEDPLGWGIRDMGNYDDRMSLYNSTPEREQRGRFQLGNEALSRFETAANDAVVAAQSTFDKQYGKGAFEEFLSDYETMLVLSSMNPDKRAAANEIQGFFNLNSSKYSDPLVANALNALKGLAMANNARRQLMKQNPDEVKRQLELEAQKAEGDDNIAEVTGAWALRATARFAKNVGALVGSEFIISHAENVLDRNQPNNPPMSEYYVVDAEDNYVLVDPESRAIVGAKDKAGDPIEGYEPDAETLQKIRTGELSYSTGLAPIMYQVGEVIGDLALDALGAGAVIKTVGIAAAPKVATIVGTISSGYLRSQSAAMEDALAHGASRGEAYRDQVIKGIMIGSTSLINPIEGALASKIYSTASGKALSNAISRYSVGKISYTDMLKEIARSAGASAVAESVEETVQDHILDRGYNAIVYGDKYTLNPHEIAETIAVSAIVGALGGTVSNIEAFSKSGLQKSAIRTVLENPKLVDQYLEGVRKVDPELAEDKAKRIAQLSKQMQTLKVDAAYIEPVAKALMIRNRLIEERDAVGPDLPDFVKERISREIEAVDKIIDDAIKNAGKKPKAHEPKVEAMPTMAEVEADAKAPPKKVRAKSPSRKIPEEAWKLKNSNNRADVQGYEAWRQQALDKKPEELLPEEIEVFGEGLKPGKTVREQLGDKAGIHKPTPRAIPNSIEAFENSLKVPGFLVGPEVKDEVDEDGKPTGKKIQTGGSVLLLSKARRGEDDNAFYYGEERAEKMAVVKRVLESVKERGGTLEDFHKELADENIVIGLGGEARWNQSITGLVSKDYQDAVFQSYLDYVKPPPPVLKKVSIKTKDGLKEFFWNNESERWEDENGVAAKGQRLSQISRALQASEKKAALEALADKIASGAKRFTKEEKQLRAEHGKTLEAMVKARTIEPVDRVSEAIPNLTKQKAALLDRVIGFITNNILKRTGTTIEEYSKKVRYYRTAAAITDERINNMILPALGEMQRTVKTVLGQPNNNLKNVRENNKKIAALGLSDSVADRWVAKALATTKFGKEILAKAKTASEAVKLLEDYFVELGELIKHSDEIYLTEIPDALIEKNLASYDAVVNAEFRAEWEAIKKNKEEFIKSRNATQKADMLHNYSVLKNATHYSIGLRVMFMDAIISKDAVYDQKSDTVSQSPRTKSTVSSPIPISEIFLASMEDSSAQSSNAVLHDYFYTAANFEGKKIDVDTYKDNVFQETPTGIWYRFSGEEDIDRFHAMSALSAGYRGAWCTGGSRETAADYLSRGDMYIFYANDVNNPTLQIAVDKAGDATEIGGLDRGQDFLRAQDSKDVSEFFSKNPKIKAGNLQNYISYKKALIKLRKDESGMDMADWKAILYGSKYYKDTSSELEEAKQRIPKQIISDITGFPIDSILHSSEAERLISSRKPLPPKSVVVGNLDFYSENTGDWTPIKVLIGRLGVHNKAPNDLLVENVIGSVYVSVGSNAIETKLFNSATGDVEIGARIANTKIFDTAGGNVDIDNLSESKTQLFDSAVGNVRLIALTKAEGKLFDSAGGYVRLSALTKAEGKLFDTAGGDVSFPNLKESKTKLFDTAGGNVNLWALREAKIKLFDTAGGDVSLHSLSESKTKLFDTAGRDVRLGSLIKAETKLFDTAGGDVSLHSLSESKTQLFDTAGGHVELTSLTKTETKLFDTAGWDVHLNALLESKTKLFDSAGGYVSLPSLTKVETKLFDTAGGGVDLSALGEAKTKLFDTVGGNLYLYAFKGDATNLLGTVEGDVRDRRIVRQENKGVFISTGAEHAMVFGKDSDLTTAIHEKAHEYEGVLTPAEIKILQKWSGHKHGTKEFSEAFAKGAERVIYEGAFANENSEIGNIFAKFAKWFKELIDDAVAYFGDINDLNDEVRMVYSKMLLEDAIVNDTNIKEGLVKKAVIESPDASKESDSDKLREIRGNRLAMIDHMTEQAEKRFPTTEAAKKIAAERQADLQALSARDRSMMHKNRSKAEVTSARSATKRAAKAKGEVKTAFDLVSRIFPTMRGAHIKVFVHDTLDSYADGLAAHIAGADRVAVTTAGAFVNNEIHIFVGSKGFTAHKALHEAVHPMLMEMIATHPELYSNFVQELVGNDALFDKYWKGFAWRNYTSTVPKNAQQARELMETLDEEALTEMLASETMRKMLEGMPKQSKTIREFLRDLLHNILEAIGLSNVSDALFKRFDPQPDVFENFFEDLKNVDDFSTRLAEVLLKRGEIPLHRAFGKHPERFSSFEDQQRQKDRIEELYMFMDELIKFGERPPTLRDAITILSAQIADGTYDLELVKNVYDETMTGDIGATTGYREWFETQSPAVLRTYQDTDIEHNKAALKALSERLGMKVFQKDHVSLPELQIEAAQDPVFLSPEEGYNVAMLVLSGQMSATAITPAKALAMAYQIQVAVEGLNDAMAQMSAMEEDNVAPTDPAYTGEAARYAALHNYIDTLKSALDQRGSELGRALSFLRIEVRTSTAQLERAVSAVLRIKPNAAEARAARKTLNDIKALSDRVSKLEAKHGPKHAEALRREFIKAFASGKISDPMVSMTVESILAKYKKKDQAKYSRIDPLYLTTGATEDMQQFLFDMKSITLIVGRNNPNLSADEVVDTVVGLYTGIGVAVNELDVYVAMTYDSLAKVEASATAYAQWKADLKKIAKQSEFLVRSVASNADELTERLRNYKAETGRSPRLSDITGDRADEYAVIKEIVDRLKAQAAAFEISPDEFRWLMDNINALDGHYRAMYRLDYPITEARLDAIIANVRNIQTFTKMDKVNKAIAAVDEKIAHLNSITNPRDRYLAIAELASINVAQYPGQQVLDKSYVHPELAKARQELADKRDELNRILQNFRATNGSKIANILRKTFNTIRAMRTSLDHSAVLNQGGPALRAGIFAGLYRTLSRGRFGDVMPAPEIGASFRDSIIGAWDQLKDDPTGRAMEDYERIINDPLYGVMKMAGLAITKPQDGGALAEEYFQESWIDDLGIALKGRRGIAAKAGRILPKLKNASEVLYVSYLNGLRASMFRQYYETALMSGGGRLTTEEMKIAAETINTFTGRASSLGPFKVSPDISQWLWAPRYYLAQIKSVLYSLHAPYMYAKSYAQSRGILLDRREIAMYGANTAMQRAEGRLRAYRFRAQGAAANMVILSAWYGMLYGGFKILCGDNGGIPLDYTKGDFLKLRCNDGVFDVSSGLAYWARFVAQVTDRIAHAHDPSVGVQTGFFSRLTWWDIVMDLIGSDKVNPVVGTIKALGTNRDFFGRPYGDTVLESLSNIMLESITPIAPSSIWELYATEEFPNALGLTAPVLMGMGFYRSQSSFNNMVVQEALHAATDAELRRGKKPTQISARPPKGLTKGDNPKAYAEYKKDWENALAQYIESNENLSYKDIKAEARRINKELQKKYKERLDNGDF